MKERKIKEKIPLLPTIFFFPKLEGKRDKREYLWWDPPITCVSLHFSLTNQIKEMKKFVLSLPSPLPSLPLFPFPSPPPFCFTKQCYSLIHILEIKITILPNYFFFLLF